MALHPTIGQFIQRDPFGYVDGLDVYEYEGDRPVNRWDPSGRCYGDSSDPSDPGHRTGGDTAGHNPWDPQPGDVWQPGQPGHGLLPSPPKPGEPILIPPVPTPGPDGKPVQLDPANPVVFQVNVPGLAQMLDKCADLKIQDVTDCSSSITFESRNNVPFSRDTTDQCAAYRRDVCALLRGLKGRPLNIPCMKKEGGDLVEDTTKKCCPQAAFNGTYTIRLSVDISLPLLSLKQCHIEGTASARITLTGTVGKCVPKTSA